MKTWILFPLLTFASGLCFADFTNLTVHNAQPGKLVLGGEFPAPKLTEEQIAVLVKGGATVKETHRHSPPEVWTTHWTILKGAESLSFSRSNEEPTAVSVHSSLALESLDGLRADQLSLRGDLANELYGILKKGGAEYTESLSCLDAAPDVCNLSATLEVGSLTCYGHNSIAGSRTHAPVVDRTSCSLEP